MLGRSLGPHERHILSQHLLLDAQSPHKLEHLLHDGFDLSELGPSDGLSRHVGTSVLDPLHVVALRGQLVLLVFLDDL